MALAGRLLPLLPLLAWAVEPPEPVGPSEPSEPAGPPLPAEPPDALFAAGAEAYARGDWPGVVLHMERALRARAALRSRLLRCRLSCANATAGLAEEQPRLQPEPEPPLRDLLFFRGLLRRAACLRRCGPAAPSRYRLGEELEREFRKRSPYNYLQVAYFKVRPRGRGRAGSAPRGPPGAELRGRGDAGGVPGPGRGRCWGPGLGGRRPPWRRGSGGGPGPSPPSPAPPAVPRRAWPRPAPGLPRRGTRSPGTGPAALARSRSRLFGGWGGETWGLGPAAALLEEPQQRGRAGLLLFG